MRNEDRTAFVAILNGLAAVKPGKGLTPEAYEIWWRSMQAWSIEDFRDAASHLVKSVEFMPSPFHFEQLRKASELTAGEAWEQVLSGRVLEPGSRSERAARIVGGQQQIRHANIEHDLPHIQRRFMEAYDELTDVDVARAALPNLGPGLFNYDGQRLSLEGDNAHRMPLSDDDKPPPPWLA